jgi:hypothetical protein
MPALGTCLARGSKTHRWQARSIANVGKSSNQTTVPAPLKNRGPSDQIDLISPARRRPRNANEFDARIKSPNIY